MRHFYAGVNYILGKGGTFVECGALDGEKRSNTLYLELSADWSGVLIEPVPEHFKLVVDKHRHAWCVNTCLSPTPYPVQVNMEVKGDSGGSSKIRKSGVGVGADVSSVVQAECFPLYSILYALNFKHIDLFSLDIEGIEPDVLEHFPFDKVDISVLIIEVIHLDREKLERILSNAGYRKVNHTKELDFVVPYTAFTVKFRDRIYVKKGLTLPIPIMRREY